MRVFFSNQQNGNDGARTEMLCPKSPGGLHYNCTTVQNVRHMGNQPTRENTFIAKEREIMCKLTKEEEYSIISRTMTNIRSLRTYVRELDFEQLLDMQEKLNSVIEERREDAERKAAERKELEAKYQQAVEYITSLGLDPEVYGSSFCYCGDNGNQTKPKGGVRKAKYIFEDENGDTKTWSGNGKMPLALRKQVNGDCTGNFPH